MALAKPLMAAEKVEKEMMPPWDRFFFVERVSDPIRKPAADHTVHSETMIDLICNSVQHAAESPARILRADFVGVDIITTNCCLSLEDSGCTANEMKTTPTLHHHDNPRGKDYSEAAVHAISCLLEKEKPSEIEFV